MRQLAVALAVGVVLAACGGGDEAEVGLVPLDGTPRIADEAGVLTDVAEDFSTIHLDDVEMPLADKIVSFLAKDATLHPVLQWEGQYVQVGVDGGEVIWVGSVSPVVDVPDEEPVAYFADVLVDITEDGLVFRSGTVLPAEGSLEVPGQLPLPVVATVDVETDFVVRLEAS